MNPFHFLSFLLLLAWNSDMVAGASAAIMGHEKTLKTEAMDGWETHSRNIETGLFSGDSGTTL